ncbi:Uncharacterised protein [Chlamydia trachomatis]|nr:Uncharacterised protein [Chlamydia trachomatis]
MLDVEAVAIASEPPAQGTGNEGKAKAQNLLSLLLNSQAGAEIVAHYFEFDFKHEQRNEPGDDVGKENAGNAPAQPTHKNNAQGSNAKRRHDATCHKELVVAQSACNLRRHLIEAHRY